MLQLVSNTEMLTMLGLMQKNNRKEIDMKKGKKGFVKFNEGEIPVERYEKWLSDGILYHFVKVNGYVYKLARGKCEKLSKNLKKRIGIVRGAELIAIEEYIKSEIATKTPVFPLSQEETMSRYGLMVKKDDKMEKAC